MKHSKDSISLGQILPDLAFALDYSEENSLEAPTVSARGGAEAAREMIRIARRYGVSVVQDPGLAQKLFGVSADEEIPPELYKEVASLFQKVNNR